MDSEQVDDDEDEEAESLSLWLSESESFEEQVLYSLSLTDTILLAGKADAETRKKLHNKFFSNISYRYWTGETNNLK